LNPNIYEYIPIGWVKTSCQEIPRHWTVSQEQGELIIKEEYEPGLQDIQSGDFITVIFSFHQSPSFSQELLIQRTHHTGTIKGVFSTCSPRRPNSIGMSVVKVIKRERNRLLVLGIDMIDGTPILDIKPYVTR